MAKNKVVDTAEIIRILGCSTLTLADWRKAGAPYSSGRPCRYNVDKLCDWLKATNRIEYAAKLEPYCVRSEPPPLPDESVELPDDSALGTSDFSLFDMRNMLADMLKSAGESYRNLRPVDKAAIAATIKTLSENFRKTEMDCLDLLERLKRTVNVDLLSSYIGAAFALTKNQLRNIPYAASQEIADEIGGDPAKIAAILKRNIDSALNAAAEKITEESIQNEINRKISGRSAAQGD